MRRLLWLFLSLSNLLLLALLILWIHSYWCRTELTWIRRGIDDPSEHFDISWERNWISSAGGILFEFHEIRDRDSHGEDWTPPATLQPAPPPSSWGLFQNPNPRYPRPEPGTTPGHSLKTLDFAGIVRGTELYVGAHQDSDASYLILPYWLLVALLLPFHFWFLHRLRNLIRRRRLLRQKGHCPICGYDLRASPTRCPECGASAAQPLPTN